MTVHLKSLNELLNDFIEEVKWKTKNKYNRSDRSQEYIDIVCVTEKPEPSISWV